MTLSSRRPLISRSTDPTSARLRAHRLARQAAGLATATAVGLGGGAVLGAATASPAAAQEVTPRPESGSVTLTGRGFGHGRGMSQWGAYGAAAKFGLDWTRILAFYYPGASRSYLRDTPIRVLISADNDGSSTVLPIAGLTAVSGARTVALPAPTTTSFRGWRIVRVTATTAALQYQTSGGSWVRYTAVPASADIAVRTTAGLSGIVKIVMPGGRLLEVRGIVHGAMTGGTVRTVLESSMESYLRGVVPSEMPASWHREGLSAQSVAARTYAARYRAQQRAKGAVWDICDTVSCQVFTGVATAAANGTGRVVKEDSRANLAIDRTRGTVLRWGTTSTSPLILAEFSASNGGYTVASGVRYQVAKPDPYDGAMRNQAWTASIGTSRLEQAYGLGRLTRIRVLQRDRNGPLGGRLLTARLEGTSRNVDVTGAALRAKFGLRSTWYAVSGRFDQPRDHIRDGYADLAWLSSGGRIYLVPSTGPSRFGTAVLFARGVVADTLIHAGQWDNAGGQDFISRRPDTGDLMLHTGSTAGRLLATKVVARGLKGYRAFAAVGDWNRDGRGDLMAIRSATGELVLFPGRSGGLVGAPVTIGSRWGAITRIIGTGDANGDGRPDIYATTSSAQLRFYPGNGTGGFRTSVLIGGGWTYADVWSPGDLTGDARPDIVGRTTTGDVRVFPGLSDGRLGASSVLLRGAGWTRNAH